LALSQYSAKTVMERIFDDQAALYREEKRKAKARAALKKFREKEKREKLEREKRSEHLRRENQDIKQRTAVYREELSFLRQVVTAHVQENGQGILEAEPVLKEFLEEKDQNSG